MVELKQNKTKNLKMKLFKSTLERRNPEYLQFGSKAFFPCLNLLNLFIIYFCRGKKRLLLLNSQRDDRKTIIAQYRHCKLAQ